MSRLNTVKEVSKFLQHLDKQYGLRQQPQSWETVKKAFDQIVYEFGLSDTIYCMGSDDGPRHIELQDEVFLYWSIYSFGTGRVELTAYAS